MIRYSVGVWIALAGMFAARPPAVAEEPAPMTVGFAETDITLSNQSEPGAIPEPPPAPPFTAPWSYGNVPPELD